MRCRFLVSLCVVILVASALSAQTQSGFNIPEGAWLEGYVPDSKNYSYQYSVLETGLISTNVASYVRSGDVVYGPFHDAYYHSLNLIDSNVSPSACKIRTDEKWFVYYQTEQFGPFRYEPLFFCKTKNGVQVVLQHEDAGGYLVCSGEEETYTSDYFYFDGKLYLAGGADTTKELSGLIGKNLDTYTVTNIINLYKQNNSVKYEIVYVKDEEFYIETNDTTLGPFKSVFNNVPRFPTLFKSRGNFREYSSYYSEALGRIDMAEAIYSDDNSKKAYIIGENEKYYLLNAGKKYGPFDEIGCASFSPDGKILAFAYRLNDRYYLSCNNEVSESFDEFVSYSFSLDSKAIAYEVKVNDAYLLFNGLKKVATFNYSDYEFRNNRHFYYSFLKDGSLFYENANPEDGAHYLYLGTNKYGPFLEISDFQLSSDGTKIYCCVLKDYKSYDNLTTDMLANGKSLKIKVTSDYFNLK